MQPIDVDTAPDVRPMVALPYEGERAVRLDGLVKAIGVLAVVLGIAGLALLPFQFLYWNAQPFNYPAPGRALYVAIQTFSFCASMTLSTCLTIAGFACLRPRPRGRRLLTAWAWGALGYAVFGIVTNAYYLLASGPGGFSSYGSVVAFGHNLRQWISVSAFALVVAVLMRNAAVRDAFRPDRGA